MTADSSGNNNTGVVMGSLWVEGCDQALEFDGVDDHIGMANGASLEITGTEITLAAWIHPHTSGARAGSRVMSKRTDGGGSDVYAMYTSQNRLRFRLDGQDLVSAGTFEPNVWVHVVMVCDGSEKRIYLNGELDPSTPQAKTDPIDASSRPVHIGMREDEERRFDGRIDELAIWNRALSPQEIQFLFEAGNAYIPLGGPPFTDITLTAGTAGPPQGGHGVMFADINGDDLPDLYLTNNLADTGPKSDFFFLNTGQNVFSEEAQPRGIEDVDGGSHGASWADLDNDGDYDLFNGSTWNAATPTFGNPDHDDLYRNNGDGFFTDMTPATVQLVLIETRGVTAFDWDRDGDVDLYGVPGLQTPGDNEVFRNDGGFQFTPVTGGALSTANGVQGVTDTDFDSDGDIDIFVANREGHVLVLVNDGNGIFTQVSPSTLGLEDEAHDGVTTADVNNDGDLDILLASNNTAHLYINQGGGTFTFRQTFTDTDGYMGGFADLDHDMDLDVVFAGDDLVYVNDGSGNFSAGPRLPVGGVLDPRAIAFADTDNDGDLDFAIAAKRSRNFLIRNNFDSGNWLKVKLFSETGQAGAFGAKTFVYPAGDIGGVLLGMRESKGNVGYLGQDDPVLHFGLGAVNRVDVVTKFLGGSSATVTNVAANQLVVIGDATPPSRPEGVAATHVGMAQIDLSWQASTDPESGVNFYNIYRDGGVVGQSNTTTFSDANLDPGTDYTYEIAAVNRARIESERSPPTLEVTTLQDQTPSAAPTRVGPLSP